MENSGIVVVYKGRTWKTFGLVLRESLFADLRHSNPRKIITIKRNGSILNIPISELLTVSENRL